MLRIVDKNTFIFIRDDFVFDPEIEIGLDVDEDNAHEYYLRRAVKTIDDYGLEHWHWEEAGTKPTKIETVEELKSKLHDTDYMIIKSYEYALAGLPLPYNIEELHAQRQNIRDQISTKNQNEKEIEVDK